MNPKEIENVILLDPFERYKYFIKKVADWEVFFTLLDDEDQYALSELDEYKLFPVWSAKEFADLCKVGGWENYKIKKLILSNLENEVVDFITQTECLINVFPVYDKTGFPVDLQEFIRDLNDELEKIQ